ncbi:unnamed protein product [Ectocarpus sp. CCAP 1310/34]|nr:unnamed protein product [Ectocarpus sp. CCAP 1310/34]
MSLVDADGAAEVENACLHPLLEAKTPRELALLVKHYRLLQGAKAAETTLTVTGRGANDGISPPGWDLSQLYVGDRIGKDSFLRVVVEAILLGYEEGQDDDESEDLDDEDVDCDDADHDWDDYDDGDGYERSFSKPHQRTKRRRFPRAHIRSRPSPRWSKKKPFAAGSATVRMRHPSSGTIFSWKTSGVKDTSGAELHEGASYRLVATVAEALAVGGTKGPGEIGVTRCRLTLVTAAASGNRR